MEAAVLTPRPANEKKKYAELKLAESIRLGLTPNVEPAVECRTFPFTGTLNDLSSWDDSTQC